MEATRGHALTPGSVPCHELPESNWPTPFAPIQVARIDGGYVSPKAVPKKEAIGMPSAYQMH